LDYTPPFTITERLQEKSRVHETDGEFRDIISEFEFDLFSNTITTRILPNFTGLRFPSSLCNATFLKASRTSSSGNKNIAAAISPEELASNGSKANDIVSEAILRGLSNFGGEDVVESLVYILELEHSVNLRTVSGELNKLRLALNAMFGAAAYVVEEKISSNLAKTLGLDPDGRSLEELTREARARFESGYVNDGEHDSSEVSE
jgi:hypothetical protein